MRNQTTLPTTFSSTLESPRWWNGGGGFTGAGTLRFSRGKMKSQEGGLAHLVRPPYSLLGVGFTLRLRWA